MKKVSFFVLICSVLMLFVLPGPGNVLKSPISEAAPAKKADFTLLVYMVGSDLESGGAAGTKDLKEMMKAVSSDKVNVIVQTGGSAKWYTNGVSANKLQRWKLTKGKMTEIKPALPLASMGKASTLSSFIQFGVKSYPASRYGLILWNHGSGSIVGYGFDENFGFDSLSLSELKTALVAGKAKFEFIGFDACLMANIETASTIAPFAKYMIGSEELEPGHGWDYTSLVNALTKKPTISGDQLGAEIVKGFQLQAVQNGDDQKITLSVMQLNQVNALIASLAKWSQAVASGISAEDKFAQLAIIRSNSESFGRGSSPDDNSDMADLGDVVSKTMDEYPIETKAVLDVLNRLVKTKLASDIAPNATGLSIYFPYYNKGKFMENLDVFSKLGMPAEYTSLIQMFADGVLNKKDGVKLMDRSLKKIKATPNPSATPLPGATPPPAGEEVELTQFVVPQEAIHQITNVYSVLGKYVDEQETKTLILGRDNLVEFDEKTGLISAEWNGEWVTLDGNFVSMNLIEDEDDHSIFAIPALLNGEDVDLYVQFDFDSGKYTLLGAWKGIDEKTGLVDKDLTPLKKGDKIVPMFEMYDETNDETTYEEGKAIIYDPKTTTLQDEVLPNGAYTFGFALEDYAQNLTYTDFDVYDVVD